MALTYRLEHIIKKISSPVIVIIGSKVLEFPDGNAAYEQAYDKYYIISDIQAQDNKVFITLIENERCDDTTWCGEEQATFF